MNNVILAYPNRADDSTVNTTTLSGGSWETDLPLSNLKNQWLSHVARSADAANASTQFDIDLGRDFRIQLLALINHNIGLSGRIRYRGYTDAAKTNNVYDSGWTDAWPVVYPTDLLEWEDNNFWVATWGQEVAANYEMFSMKVLDPKIVARYWLIEIDDTSNVDGYIEIGRLIIAAGWQPTYNIKYGYNLSWDVQMDLDITLGGVKIASERAAGRIAEISFSDLTDDEAMAVMLDMQKILGKDGQVFVVLDPDDTIHMIRRSFLATIQNNSGIAHVLYNRHQTSLKLTEVI